MSQKTRAKYGYLTYNDMLIRITDGELDAYDIVYTKDTRETFVITPELEPMSIKSRVYVFDSTIEAEEYLNSTTDAYVGQIISVLYGDTYRGYIVNESSDKYYVVPLYAHPEPIDYNTLGNKPITSLTGTLEDTIIISSLDIGTYSINGRYKITESDVTVHLNPNYNLFLIDKTEEQITIKIISSTEIINYVIVDDEIVKNDKIITEEFLKEKGYATVSYVDGKIATLDVITKEEAETYISTIVNEKFETALNDKIDERIDAKIQSANDDQIASLFKN